MAQNYKYVVVKTEDDLMDISDCELPNINTDWDYWEEEGDQNGANETVVGNSEDHSTATVPAEHPRGYFTNSGAPEHHLWFNSKEAGEYEVNIHTDKGFHDQPTNHTLNKHGCDKIKIEMLSQPHIEKYENMGPFIMKPDGFRQCHFCDFQTKNKKYISEHIGRKHLKDNGRKHLKDNITMFKCPHSECSYKAISKSELNQHTISRHTDEKNIDWFYCNSCCFRTKWKQYLNVHKKNRHVKKHAEHLPEHLTNNSKTPKHPWGFNLKGAGESEINLNTDEEMNKRFHCNQCSFKTSWKYSLAKHKLTKHACDKMEMSSPIVINCENAKQHTGYEYMEPFILKPDGFTQCLYCDFQTRNKKYISEHIGRKHLKDSISVFRCSKCSFEAKSKSELKSHIIGRHTEEKKINWFYCDRCSYRTKWKHALNGHKKVKHVRKDEIQWFSCRYEHCSFKTKWKHALKGHVKDQHTSDLQLFSCSQCDFVTSWKHALNAHIKAKH